jgi:hypothetical protein
VFDFLGFPWILSCESRLFNGLHWKSRAKFFGSVFPDVGSVKQRSACLGAPQRRSVHEGKHTVISDSLQQFVAGSVSPAIPWQGAPEN